MKSRFLALVTLVLLTSSPSLGEEGVSHEVSVPEGWIVHELAPGESLDNLATYYGVTLQELVELNGKQAMANLDRLRVPKPQKGWPIHRVAAGQTLWKISRAYDVSLRELRQLNALSGNEIRVGQRLSLPRANPPEWAETNHQSGFSYTLDSKIEDLIEVSLPDGRKAWVKQPSVVLESPDPRNREEVVEIARRFLGVPYLWGGTTPHGYDCSGFIQEVFRLGGHSVPRLADVQYQALSKVSRKDIRPGDLVFFNTDGSGVSHVGVSSGDGVFLHASSSRGVVESNLEQAYYSERFVGAARLSDWPESSSRK